MNALDYALYYAGRGWRVFPVHTIREIKGRRWCSCDDAECQHQGKHPVAKLAPQGVKNATCAAPEIRKWWSVFPDANIGIATGRESGIVVIDVDTDESKGKVGAESLATIQEQHGELPDTITVITGSGGLHYFFEYPELAERVKSTTNVIGKDIDSRGDGGYVVGVPSLHINGGQYLFEGSSDPTEGAKLAALPQYFLDVLQASNSDHDPIPEGAKLSAVEVRELRAALSYINPDDRQEWLNVGMALHSTGAGNQAFGLWAEWSQGSDKYNAADQRRVWKSFKSGGITKSTIFQTAQLAGWINTASKRVGNSDVVVPFSSSERKARPESGKWRELLSKNDRGVVHASIANIVLILQNDERWQGVIGWDEFSLKIVKRKNPPFDIADTGEWTDRDDKKLVVWLSRFYSIRPTTNNTADAVQVVAEYQTFHPVRDYLESITWDQKPRTKMWAIKFLGAQDTAHVRLVAEKWLVAAVARVYQPGCKFDNVLILEGKQGVGKSQALAALGGDWFSDTPFELGSRDGFLAMRGHWVIELAELDSFNRAESTKAKHFFAANKDTYREPYGRRTVDVLRQCVFAGTTNADEYLRDETGNRRYFPIACGDIRVDALRHYRDQIWAEAVALYKAGEKWWFEGQLEYVKQEQEDRFMRDAWEAKLAAWINQRFQAHQAAHSNSTLPFYVTVADALSECLEIPAGKWTRLDQMRVASALKRCGLSRRKYVLPAYSSEKKTEWGYGYPIGQTTM